MLEPAPRYTVLVVDDTPENLLLYSHILKKTYQVKVAPHGEKALAIVQATLPDLILLDVLMPGMDGYEVYRRLKADPRTAAVPVIFLTARVESEALAHARAAGISVGAADMLIKPVDSQVLLARIAAGLSAATATPGAPGR
ncbi:response regulator [Roseateles koreensis]|uniref:Response regulator n=1 Tax=Roseateles koreensis TaxID=2987526 RepID=A0ABT5KMI4_9BURK|nr:response regulator [Roseateles koreensis]MDC8784124.1 response regulator [Roseateles koreensis]